MSNILLAVTTFNQLEYTKIFYKSYLDLLNKPDLIIFDDASTDETVTWCVENGIKVITKSEGKGLTDSWNSIYKYFKDHIEYDYVCIANNDIVIPTGALEELERTHIKWPSVCIVPITTAHGSGHNHIQGISNHYENADEAVESVQNTQNIILSYLNSNELKNRRFLFDPIRMLMFNGFFFSFKRKIAEYERTDGNLFNPEFLNFKNEDDFNWNVLIANDEYPMLCKTSYVYHFKGKSFSHIQDPKTNDLSVFINNRIK